jgi:uncharacterized DUF497 family protein
MQLNFEWDPRKALANAAKHGVTFAEAVTAFEDPLAVTVRDPRHSAAMFTDRGEALRIISAREMTPGERREYESGGEHDV